MRCVNTANNITRLAAPLLLLLALFTATPSPAQTSPEPAAPAAGLTQAETDALVDRISTEVVRRLRAEGLSPATPAAAPATTPAGKAKPTADAPMMADDSMDEDYVRRFARAGSIFMALPALGDELARVPGMLTSMEGERPLGSYLALLLLAGVLVIAADAAARIITDPLRRSLAAHMHGSRGVGALALLALLDALGLIAAWLVSHGLLSVWFPGTLPQSRFASLVLLSVFSWLLYMFVFRAALRPKLRPARLVEISDDDASAIFRAIGIVVAMVLVSRGITRVLTAIGAPEDVTALAEILEALVVVAAFIIGAVRQRHPAARFFLGLSRRAEPHPVIAGISQHWIAVAIPFFLILGIARIHGAVMDQTMVPEALVTTLNVVIGLLLMEAVTGKVTRLVRGPHARAADGAPHLPDVVARCLRFAVFMIAGLYLAEVWILDVLALASMMDTGRVTAGVLAVGTTAFVSYCSFEAIRYLTDRYAARAYKPVMPGAEDPDGDTPAVVESSRAGTLVPLVRVVLYATLAILVTLTVLSQLGINITALIAGASVVGLAISFGSQTLVKDIVSGVFYLVDDAFRVGEYIDVGKGKGTVEGFTMRSLKLRHQSGQIHTIPFGQLGQITNFSRDWTTAKFNLRFMPNTDLEKLRKVVKKIGVEMMDDPEMKDEILMPLKMQGVADITDSAIVVRFKFTVKPNKPSYIQREALKRMFRAFPEVGIEFANAVLALQNLGGRPEGS
ncbi:mechanosensitive ion channel family protein [Starkeya sp. ORNL1]|uniref:mechanosensitive ion channel family protein n=1 Tax=Starkeya sp. ORNL1 TaxID=2709380 RepID=UPI001463C659|nr:mechanosensitive ion channel domain-containing protein [Starkeya sp. ORNL1]QJP13636.1 mechanosensitive ion channel family protein [Starkeya sp. ORNL1]